MYIEWEGVGYIFILFQGISKIFYINYGVGGFNDFS